MARVSAAALARKSAIAGCGALALTAWGCGSSSQTITAPPPARCAVQALVEDASFPVGGGSSSLRISTNRECAWTVLSDAPWLKADGPAEGQGEAVVNFTVAANADPASRSANFTVNANRVEIHQDGRPCAFELSSTRESIDAGGGDRTIHVKASSAQCSWTAAPEQPWIVIKAGNEGRGSGAVTFHVTPMSGPPRAGVLTIAGHRVAIEQGGGCTLSIAAFDQNVPAAGGPLNVAISSPSGCTWAASSQSVWITIRSGDTGTGSGQVQFIVVGNTGPAREGILTVAGRTFIVTQASGCTYSLAPGVENLPPTGGAGALSVTTGPACPWTASSTASWLTVVNPAGTGSAQVQYTSGANMGMHRTAALTVEGHRTTFNQPSVCSFVLAPPYLTYDASGGNGAVLVIVSGPCTWTASSSVDWISMVSGTAGEGNGLVQFTVASNSGQSRSATLSIAGQSFSVTQAGK